MLGRGSVQIGPDSTPGFPGIPLPGAGSGVTVAVGYLAASTLVYGLVPPTISPLPPMFFPPAGLAFGYLLLAGVRHVPVVFGAFLIGELTSRTTGMPVGAGWLLRDAALTLAYAGCATVLRHRWRDQTPFGTLTWFVLSGLVAAPILSATAALGVARMQGLLSDSRAWAGAILGTAAAVATLAPAAALTGRKLMSPNPAVVRAPWRVRTDALALALALIVGPAIAVLIRAGRPDELPWLGLALLPLAWITVRPRIVAASLILAASGLVLGATVTARYGQTEELFRAQTLMVTSALATLFVSATLTADGAARRAAEFAASSWRAVLDAAPVVVAWVGRDGNWRVERNDSNPDDADVVSAEQSVPELNAALQARRQSTVHWTLDAPRRTASRHFVTQLTPMPDGETLAVTSETTRVHGAEAALAWERTHDRDSGRPNRDLLLATAQRGLDEGETSSLVVVDIDPLTRHAALVGAEMSDLVRALGRRMDEALASDAEASRQDLVARIADDQFAVLLGQDTTAAARRAGRLLAALSRPLTAAGHVLPVPAAAGVAPVGPECDPREALRRATTAAQAARESGRGEVVVFDGLAMTSAAERVRLVGEVIAAVEGGDLDVVFQPDVALPDGRLAGVEALVRWRRRVGYLAATDLFVRLAEETGKVQALDAWVMEESLRRLGEWRRSPAADHLELGLNVSALSLTDDLPTRLKEACDRHRVPPSRIRLEVTETAVGDEGDAVSVLEQVRATGVRVALDDFGTGWASLSRLRDLPVDMVKLDRSFLPVRSDDAVSRALVSLVLGLAEPMRIEVLVEGVETPAQRDLLVQLDCRRAQGFLFSRPAPAAAIPRLIAAPLIYT